MVTMPGGDGNGGGGLAGQIVLPGDRKDAVEVEPEPKYVLKTRVETSLSTNKLFINVCTSDVIAEPSTRKRLDAEGKEIEGLNVPVSVGSLRSCTDKVGKPAKAIDVIVSPRIIIHQENADSSSDSLLGGNRDFLNQFILQCVEQKCSTGTSTSPSPNEGPVKIDRKYTLPKLSYQGYVDSFTGLPVDKTSEFAEVAKQMVRDVTKQPVIEEVEPPRPTASGSSVSSSEESDPTSTLPIECSMSIEAADGTMKPLSEYIEAFNASLGGDAVVSVELSAHSKGSLLLISNASDTKSSIPSLHPKIVHVECQAHQLPEARDDPRRCVCVCSLGVFGGPRRNGLHPPTPR